MHATFDSHSDITYAPRRATMAAASVGIQRVVLVGNSYYAKTTKEECERENDFLLTEAARDPSHRLAAPSVPVLAEWSMSELERVARTGARLIKIHPLASKVDFRKSEDVGRLDELLREADRRNLTVLLHGNYPGEAHRGEASILLGLVARYPGLRTILAHALAGDHRLLRGVQQKNVFVDLSGVLTISHPPDVRDFLESLRSFGFDRVLFGSDWPAYHPAETLHALRRIGLTPDEIAQILENNARPFDELFTPRPR